VFLHLFQPDFNIGPLSQLAIRVKARLCSRRLLRLILSNHFYIFIALMVGVQRWLGDGRAVSLASGSKHFLAGLVF
jgi:hypothetical protein